MPWHTGLEEAAMVTETGNNGVTVIVTALEVAGLPVAQDAFDVRTQVIISPLDGIIVNAGLFVPVLIPLTFHW